jgi:hypothetical protein
LKNVNSTSSLAILPNNVSVHDCQPPTEGYGFSVSRYSLEELDKKEHDSELEPTADQRVFVHIDSRTMGVGGYDSWSPNVDADCTISTTSGPILAHFTLLHKQR